MNAFTLRLTDDVAICHADRFAAAIVNCVPSVCTWPLSSRCALFAPVVTSVTRYCVIASLSAMTALAGFVPWAD